MKYWRGHCRADTFLTVKAGLFSSGGPHTFRNQPDLSMEQMYQNCRSQPITASEKRVANAVRAFGVDDAVTKLNPSRIAKAVDRGPAAAFAAIRRSVQEPGEIADSKLVPAKTPRNCGRRKAPVMAAPAGRVDSPRKYRLIAGAAVAALCSAQEIPCPNAGSVCRAASPSSTTPGRHGVRARLWRRET